MARILVVEDNLQNLKLATVILTTAGHTVVGARDAAEVERSIATEVPDLILMDIALPGKDGYAVTRELRQRSETARLPILAVSSFAMRGDAERALAAGCTAYLTKPIHRVVLLDHVDALLGTHRPATGARADPGPGGSSVPGGPSRSSPAESETSRARGADASTEPARVPPVDGPARQEGR